MWRHALLKRKIASLAKRDFDEPLASYLTTPLPDPRANWKDIDYVALDIETTGLDASKDAMLSVGWVLVSGGRVELSTAQSLLVRPDTGVGQSATIHGLTDSQVLAGQEVEVVINAILSMLSGRVLLVHYAKLDKGVIDRQCKQLYGTAVPLLVVDTMEIEIKRRRRQHHTDDQQSLRLTDLRTAYNLPYYHAHNCLTDAIATAELFLAMVARAGKDAHSLGDLL